LKTGAPNTLVPHRRLPHISHLSTMTSSNNDPNKNKTSNILDPTVKTRRISACLVPDYSDSTGPYGRPSYLQKTSSSSLEEATDGDLLVDFPSRVKEQNCNSDSGGTNEQKSESARLEELANAPPDSNSLPGGAMHRPLVGGFAAAAYEAARDLHYNNVKESDSSSKEKKNQTMRPII